MNRKNIKKHSKFLSLVLRHRPEKIGIKLDAAGWTSVTSLLEALSKSGHSLTLDELKFIVENNDKKRFSFSENGKMIRANQGHSVDVKLDYPEIEPHSPLYHGTITNFLDNIYKDGLKKMKRHHVHLSGDLDTAIKVARRRNSKIVILVIDAKQMYEDGFVFYLSDNGVWLTDCVPPKYIVETKYV